MKSIWLRSLVTLIVIFYSINLVASDTTRVVTQTLRADPDNGGLTLQKGFGAIVVVPELGRNRHIAINSNGDIYVKLERPKNGKGILVLKEDANGKGKLVDGFGSYGGTGIAIKNGYLYASSDNVCTRYN
jgi:hypothetical protein